MPHPESYEEQALTTLNRTVADAVEFFATAEESVSDGYQTARQVLSHLIFWHREYVRIARALVQDHQPKLRSGKFKELNALAWQEFENTPMPVLAKRLARLQSRLEKALPAVPDPRTRVPFKEGGGKWRLSDWASLIEPHIRNHVARLRRASAKRISGETKRRK